MADGSVLAVIGGSGLYDIGGLTDVEQIRTDTPFGPPSDVIVRGRLGATTLLFLPRHGRGHRIAPHQINFRANVCALKTLGATHLLSISAVGSMREEIAPGDFVVVDQFIDLTRRRTSTFFEDGLVAHVAFADPVCDRLAAAVVGAAGRALGVGGGAAGPAGAQEPAVGAARRARVHARGTYVCIDGPQFSTRAESELYRSWGVSVIGMTGMPEAKLAREAELPYALLALATDYDCWHETEEDVSAEAIMAIVRSNVAAARNVVVELARSLPDPSESRATGALSAALMTARDAVPQATIARLGWLVDKYMRRQGDR
ncbi:MAG TPA: S-methyl-5'-thioadenosine phosphorylase [Polyangiaceae bacterium]|nr:S-methyl-5'-thioadenosine phosphorylase [Polyangiaceae bacterium]